MSASKLNASRILIVDDDVDYGFALSGLLRRLRYSDVTTCSEPHRAMSLVRESRPHLLILDLLMPGKSGLQILTEVGELPVKEQPGAVLVITGHDGSGVPAAVRRYGGEAVLSKPIKSADLHETVANLLLDATEQQPD